MFRALENLVEFIVDGDYEELHQSSGNRLEMRICAGASRTTARRRSSLPPREIYRVEAITRSDDPEEEGWTFFLDLWTETGPATLHVEGYILEASGNYEVTLTDILP